jgi:hypothetical protein
MYLLHRSATVDSIAVVIVSTTIRNTSKPLDPYAILYVPRAEADDSLMSH